MTALAGSIVYFILPQLIESPYDLPTISVSPDTLSSVTVVSTASGVTYYAGWPMDQAMLDALGGVGENPAVFTLMDQTYMGTGSVEDAGYIWLLSCVGDQYSLMYAHSGGDIVKSFDRATTVTAYTEDIWDRGEIHRRIVETNPENVNQYRVGYQRLTSELIPINAGFVYSDWATFDGSMDPLTIMKIFFAADSPNYKQLVSVANKTLSENEKKQVFWQAGRDGIL